MTPSEKHRFFRGKMETVPRCCIEGLQDFADWYSPGVAEPCLEIAKNPDLVYDYTNKWNSVAVVSDGSRVLGLGDIGPKAGLPVMEGKALLFKYLGGVDSTAIVLDVHEPQQIIDTVLAIQPSFGGINLEDIAQPKCFEILDTLRKQAEIPVWHDDQQGTATVTLAALQNALKIVGKKIEEARIVFVGAGAANIACARLIFARGARPGNCLMLDVNGLLGSFRRDVEAERAHFAELWRFCQITNDEGRRGGIEDALRGADAVISYSVPKPGTIRPEWIKTMAKDPIVFACANPSPEIWPKDALAAGAAVVATGRSDLPNQVNNSLVFPAIFRGVLDVRATSIHDAMCFAAADALSSALGDKFTSDHLLPTMQDSWVFPHIAAAVGVAAQKEGLARLSLGYDELLAGAQAMISRSQAITKLMMEHGLIPRLP